MRRATMAKPRPRRKPLRNVPASIPVEQTNLTIEERALLPNPTVLTEDDADALTVIRKEMRNAPTIPWEEYLKKHGRRRR